MKIRLEEEIITLGDFEIVRIDDYNVELRQKGELIGYYGFMCHAVKASFVYQMNEIRKQGKYTDILGDVDKTADELFNSVPKKAVYDFSSKAKEELLID